MFSVRWNSLLIDVSVMRILSDRNSSFLFYRHPDGLPVGMFLVLVFLVICSCSKEPESFFETGGMQDGAVVFTVEDKVIDADCHTKADTVFELEQFTAGIVADYSSITLLVDDNRIFYRRGGDYVSDLYWPDSGTTLWRFVCSNVPLSYSSDDGFSIHVSTDTDAVVSVLSQAVPRRKNVLTFEHVLGMIGVVTVNEEYGWEISDVRLSFVPCIEGDFNISRGYGRTDGTGWSNLVPGEECVLASSVGFNHAFVWAVPGNYSVVASWVATRGTEVRSFDNYATSVEVVAGRINSFTVTLGGTI